MAAPISPPSPLHELVQQAVDAVDAQPVRAPERRSAPRVPCSMAVQVVHDGAALGAIARDLSPGGMAIEMNSPVQLGEILEVRFQPNDQLDIACVGLVRSVQVDSCVRVGVEFHNLLPKDRWALATHVRDNLHGESGEARERWADRSDVGEATRVEVGYVLRWSVPFTSLWADVVQAVSAGTTFFMPIRESGAREGDRVIVEVVPPESHAVLQMQAEVTWVGADGLGLRHAGLTVSDRTFLASITAHFVREAARHR